MQTRRRLALKYLSQAILLACAAWAAGCATVPRPPTEASVAASLRQLHLGMPQQCPIPSNGAYSVKYYQGISHSFHGILVQGHTYGADEHIPPADGKFYHEFYSDQEGRLVFVVAHPPDGQRYVTDHILYEQGQPFGRLSYSKEGLSYGDYVYYHRGRPYLSCRIWKEGDAVQVKMERITNSRSL